MVDLHTQLGKLGERGPREIMLDLNRSVSPFRPEPGKYDIRSRCPRVRPELPKRTRNPNANGISKFRNTRDFRLVDAGRNRRRPEVPKIIAFLLELRLSANRFVLDLAGGERGDGERAGSAIAGERDEADG